MSEIRQSYWMSALAETKKQSKISSERLAYWYFRLNGFLTIQNFVVHPDWTAPQCTDIDLLAVRFPYRAELLKDPMEDDNRLILDPHKIRIILAEVKTGRIKLNKAWTNPSKKNFQRMLRAVGAIERERVKDVSDKIYNNGWYEERDYVISLCCLGRTKNQDFLKRYPKMPQLSWEEILSFIYQRFKYYHRQKCQHDQWDKTGQILWDHAEEYSNEKEFCTKILEMLKASN